MPANRYYANDLTSDRITLEEKEFHHLKHVMRASLHESIELIDGKGVLATGEISALLKHHAEITITKREVATPQKQEMVLCVAFMRPERLSFIVEKGTELGVTHFWLFPGEASEVKAVSLPRYEQLIISATKQCGRLFLPEISLHPKIKEWKKPVHPLYFGDVRKGAQKVTKTGPSVQIVIGPESGFTDREVKLLEKLGQGVTLSENILRSETAALVAIALFSNRDV